MRSRVLLVDDEPSIQFGVGRYFEQNGFEVEGAACLGEGQERLRNKSFDGIILDLSLPDGNGLDWIATLKKEYPGMAIVVVTGTEDVNLANKAKSLGADGFLQKPFDLNALKVCLEQSIERTLLRPPASRKGMSARSPQ